MRKVLGLVIAALLLTACGSVPLTGRKQFLLVSDADVITASLSEYNEYMKTAKKSTNKTQTAMVERVGKNIASATEAYLKANGLESMISEFAWEFNLVQSDELNAFCMPGGKIVVYEGLLPLTATDDELGVVLGHEVAHAVAKHSNERMSQELMVEYGASILDVALSGKSAAVQELGSTIFGLGAQVGVMLPYSRKHELEADHLGLAFMTMAGYDPNKAVTFWQKMSAASGNGDASDLLSTHPNDATRIAAIQGYMPEMQQYKQTK